VDAVPYSGSTITRGWGVFTFSNQSVNQHRVFSAYRRTASKFLYGFVPYVLPRLSYLWSEYYWPFVNQEVCSIQTAFVFQNMYVVATLEIKYILRQLFFFHWRYSPLWALACRKIPLHFFLSIINSLHLLTPSTWRFLSASSLHHFLGLPLRLVPSSSWVKIFLGILCSSILSRWHSQRILCPFIHFTVLYTETISYTKSSVCVFRRNTS
jgi:hypothetical protein